MDEPLTLFPPEVRSTDDLLAGSAEVLERVVAEHKPSRRFLLFSGGNDSLVVLDAMARHADEIVHVDTGIGIPETDAFAARVAKRYDLPYTVLSPPKTYEELVFAKWGGMPGPGMHKWTYINLKERCVRALIRHHRRFNGERFLLMSGIRKAESTRRMGHAEEVHREGGQVWVNPMLDWPNANMAEYRQGQSLPINEVSANLHMSGECLCGAMADQRPKREEREAIRFFYPPFDARLGALERECKARGLPYDEWGVKRGKDDVGGPMCSSCDFRGTLLDPAIIGTPVTIGSPTA